MSAAAGSLGIGFILRLSDLSEHHTEDSQEYLFFVYFKYHWISIELLFFNV